MIKKLHIDKFRLFQDIDFELAPVLTAIAGHNATGKSTVLGIIGNSAALPKNKGETLLNTSFQTEFSEILKGSHEKDVSGNIGYIEIDNLSVMDTIEPIIKLRVTWQNKGTRFRVIPKRKYFKGKSPLKHGYDNRKLTLPSYYLGLGRLYPIGETSSAISHNRLSLTEDEMQWYIENYNRILSLELPTFNLDAFNNKEKKSVGITTDTYDFLCNSAGQDNLSQIMMIILSFKKLKDRYESLQAPWEGGVMLIDEIDATLHPYAQYCLIDFLYKEAVSIGIQIVFTTHSLSVLEHINQIGKRHSNCNILYLSSANGPLELLKNPDMDLIRNDMEVTSLYDSIGDKRIKIYSEDAEARYFLNHLLSDYSGRISLVNYSEGAEKLLSLIQNDPSSFCNILFILDGDMDCESEPYKTLSYQNCNLLTLPAPSLMRPEQVLYEYIINLPPDHTLLATHRTDGFTIRKIKEAGPDSPKYAHLTEARKKYKQWFIDNKEMFNSIKLLEFWESDNAELVSQFKHDFINKFNILASRLHYPKI